MPVRSVILTLSILIILTGCSFKNIDKRFFVLLLKIRNAGVDPYGFGLHYLAEYFGKEEEWKHWQSVYKQVKFEVNSRVIIDSMGLVRY